MSGGIFFPGGGGGASFNLLKGNVVLPLPPPPTPSSSSSIRACGGERERERAFRSSRAQLTSPLIPLSLSMNKMPHFRRHHSPLLLHIQKKKKESLLPPSSFKQIGSIYLPSLLLSLSLPSSYSSSLRCLSAPLLRFLQ